MQQEAAAQGVQVAAPCWPWMARTPRRSSVEPETPSPSWLLPIPTLHGARDEDDAPGQAIDVHHVVMCWRRRHKPAPQQPQKLPAGVAEQQLVRDGALSILRGRRQAGHRFLHCGCHPVRLCRCHPELWPSSTAPGVSARACIAPVHQTACSAAVPWEACHMASPRTHHGLCLQLICSECVGCHVDKMRNLQVFNVACRMDHCEPQAGGAQQLKPERGPSGEAGRGRPQQKKTAACIDGGAQWQHGTTCKPAGHRVELQHPAPSPGTRAYITRGHDVIQVLYSLEHDWRVQVPRERDLCGKAWQAQRDVNCDAHICEATGQQQ